jgi:Flp pilus assembly pilin Flp
MKNLLKILWLEQNGQDLTEYALLLGLLALGAIASIGTIAKTINNVFANAASNIGTAAGHSCGGNLVLVHFDRVASAREFSNRFWIIGLATTVLLVKARPFDLFITGQKTSRREDVALLLRSLNKQSI